MTTTIDLPVELKHKAQQAADARGVSLDEIVQEALAWLLTLPIADDPLYRDNAVYSGDVPEDISAHHDQYIYGESE